MLHDECIELRHELGVPAQLKIGLDPLLDSREADFGEAGLLGSREGRRVELGKGHAAPEREGLAQRIGGGSSLLIMCLGHQPLETIQVDGVRLDVDEIALWPRLDALRAQALSQLGHVYLKGGASRLRRIAVPELVDQAVPRHDLVGAEEEGREQRTLLGASKVDAPVIVLDLEWSEDSEFHVLLAV